MRCMSRVLLLSLVVLLVCGQRVSAEQVRDEMLVSTDWLQAHRSAVKLIEIGDRASYLKAHIPGAVLIEPQSIVTQTGSTPNELPSIPQLESVFTNAGLGWHGQIVLYSRDPMLATRAWFTLDYAGAGARTSILDGGIGKWIAEGRIVSTEVTTPKPATFNAAMHDQAVTHFPAMRDAVRVSEIVGPYLVIIDAREQRQYSGSEAGQGVSCAGHIPGAVNIPMNLNFTSSDTPVFKSAGELRALYNRAGVTRVSRNVVYCRTGMQATVTYFVLKYLGYDASLYDGSFVEWSNSGAMVN